MKHSNKITLSLMVSMLLASTSAFAAEQKPKDEQAQKESAAPSPTQDEEITNYNEETLTGDWGGLRTDWAKKGIEIDALYRADVMGVASGGIKTGTRFLDNLDVKVAIDGEKLFGSKGTSAFIHVLNNDGGTPDADLVGSANGINNYEVPKTTAKLYQAWIQQNFMDDKLSILAGLYDINSEFYVTDSSALFIGSNFGIGTDIAQSGQNGPSIFPFTSVGTRIKVQPTENWYAQVAVLDGVPGDLVNLEGTHVHLDHDDGGFVVGETGLATDDYKLGVGGWYYTTSFADQVTGEPQRSDGFYFIGETSIYKETQDQGLKYFAHLGFANEEVNQFDYAWSTGLVYTGLFEGRDEGQLGLGLSGAHNGDSYVEAQNIATTPVESAETQIELTYFDKITPWLSVQPDVQYVINPGTTVGEDNALVLGLRVGVQF